MLPPVDSIHDLQRPAGTWLFAERSQKAHELLGFFGQTEAQEGVHRECRIPDPGVAVIPVALAANSLRQAARGRGDNRAGRLVGQQLQGEGGTVHHFSPAASISDWPIHLCQNSAVRRNRSSASSADVEIPHPSSGGRSRSTKTAVSPSLRVNSETTAPSIFSRGCSVARPRLSEVEISVAPWVVIVAVCASRA